MTEHNNLRGNGEMIGILMGSPPEGKKKKVKWYKKLFAKGEVTE